MNNIIQVNTCNSQKLIKYILMGLIVILCLKYIPETILNLNEILIIGIISSIAYAILDMISPTIKIHYKN
jgi:hypothetical protein